ncbi:PhoH family protein [Swaminathania salitolerans]|uniref:PhoH-like protein n=1 Tax=Swaminathania salitolerans TaxID=182838 RepID=A0A511BMU2_9PROT|nr:phosphate starvation-inducible protein PhoH [Swaminathania salitolerans LMG 21291]GEL01650.1 phosphate starvation protein PhoH [Swaminathania salitolerans]
MSHPTAPQSYPGNGTHERSNGRNLPDDRPSKEQGQRTSALRFGDNILLQQLLGDHDRHLIRLEQGFDVRLTCRGNKIAITGEAAQVARAQAAITALYNQLEHGGKIDGPVVDSVIRLSALPRPSRPAQPVRTTPSPAPEAGQTSPLTDLPAIRTKRGAIAPRSRGQAAYMEMLAKTELTFGIGPAGTGKTYLAVAQGVAMLQAGQVDRIILSRPAVEAGERLGFLPGDLREKIDPYLRPLYDALNDMLPGDQVARRMANGEIEVAPLAFMRGRTLAHAFVILDEAQNTTPAQMKMFLTRMGQGARMVITGDLSQIDLPAGITSGLREAVETLEGLPGIGITRFDSTDVVRHPLVARIVDAYDQRVAAARDYSRGRTRREYNGTSK